ncbi:hypothetical protein [Soonwooa sp.]|uniref:hypothetical protein n=1 Tax=Soonwooa sp. TaxID=1938592 RepID=UPI0026214F1D|nr:hypothetical protein [Soonwooa sp.]
MTDKNTTLKTLEKIKSFAIALVGAGIFSMGSTYFSEQSAYRIPRVLLPVYELLGNVGLALGMLILGAGLMYFAYRKYIKNEGKTLHFLIFLVVAILGFYAIVFLTMTKKTSIEDVKTSLEKGQEAQQNKINNTERPTLESALANKYLDNLEALERKFEESINTTNEAMFYECENEHSAMISKDFGDVVKEISRMPEYKDFAYYNAKVEEKIQKLRVHKW